MPHRWRRFVGWGVVIIVILAAITGLGYLLLRTIPNALVEAAHLTPNDAALERGRIRTGALVFLGGVVAVAGAIFTGLTFRLSQRGQGTERFNKAIELMGSLDKSVRLGGIEALGQLASDDPRRHHRAVLEVLLAYVREHSPWDATTAAGVVVPTAPADVKAAMAVLARRRASHDPERLFIDLSNTNLRGIGVEGIHLRGALLDGTQLQEADLRRAELQGVVFINANLAGAELDDATLDHETSFEKANLAGASLRTTIGVYRADFKDAVHGETDWPDGIPPPGLLSAQ